MHVYGAMGTVVEGRLQAHVDGVGEDEGDMEAPREDFILLIHFTSWDFKI